MHHLNIYQYIVSLKRSIKPLELYDSNLKVWIVSTLGSLKVTKDISSYKKKKARKHEWTLLVTLPLSQPWLVNLVMDTSKSSSGVPLSALLLNYSQNVFKRSAIKTPWGNKWPLHTACEPEAWGWEEQGISLFPLVRLHLTL